MYHLDDTIAAVASAAGGAARGILRVSGPQAAQIVAAIFRPDNGQPLAAVRSPQRIAGTLELARPDTPGWQLPAALYLWPGPRSYTRQPTAELHTLGSPPLLAAALRALTAAGARPAEPGEFTLRAFLAGRLDLTQAEAVLGVIDAAAEAELEAALRQLAGGLAEPLHALREQLLNLLAHLEAGLDFVEEDIEFISPGELAAQLAAASSCVAGLVERMAVRTDAADLPRVVLIGSPNVGKSSLFNALCGAGGALVADEPGTTRDFVSALVDLGDCRCELIDTAGVAELLGDATDSLHIAAQQVTAVQRQRADVRILCLDSTRALNAWERAELDAAAAEGLTQHAWMIVGTKCDLGDSGADAGALATSSQTGAGLPELRRQLREAVVRRARPEGSAVLLTAQRAGASLLRAGEALEGARQAAASGRGEEIVAADIRSALEELGRVVGAVYTDDILDRVFSRFCIGK